MTGEDFGKEMLKLAAKAAALQRDHTSAIELGEKALEHDPDDVGLLIVVSRSHWFKGNYEEAHSYASRAVDLAPNDPECWLCEARALGFGGDAAKGVEFATQALALNPTLSDAYETRAMLHDRAGNTGACISDLSSAIALGEAEMNKNKELLRAYAPSVAHWYYLRGKKCDQGGLEEPARSDFESALVLDITRRRDILLAYCELCARLSRPDLIVAAITAFTRNGGVINEGASREIDRHLARSQAKKV